ncbi:hypothetical protein ACL02S_22805 [Nocardia sp. 004]|uniref:hypothetical protein n=1 Tax=Nocardia sp. 004 TaxID=3385978 RepID=UPI0039A170E5
MPAGSWPCSTTPTTTMTPAVLVLTRSHRAVTAISVAGSLLTEHCVPAPEHHPPIVDHADQLNAQLMLVIGDYLRLRHSITGDRPADPMLYWVGPNLDIAEHLQLQLHCDRVARDDTAQFDQRRAAAHTANFASFVGMQLGGPMHWLR